MQVFQHKDEGALGREHLDGLSQFPQHPFTRDVLIPDVLAFAGSEKRRHVREPTGRVLPQERDEGVTIGCPAESS